MLPDTGSGGGSSDTSPAVSEGISATVTSFICLEGVILNQPTMVQQRSQNMYICKHCEYVCRLNETTCKQMLGALIRHGDEKVVHDLNINKK